MTQTEPAGDKGEASLGIRASLYLLYHCVSTKCRTREFAGVQGGWAESKQQALHPLTDLQLGMTVRCAELSRKEYCDISGS